VGTEKLALLLIAALMALPIAATAEGRVIRAELGTDRTPDIAGAKP
jgi:hypothetical protein